MMTFIRGELKLAEGTKRKAVRHISSTNLALYAPVNGMPHHPYMRIMWGDGRGLVQYIMP